MKSFLRCAIPAALLFIGVEADAVVLGESFARSNFGSPLYAEVEMFEVTDAELLSMRIEEAGAEEYAANRLKRPDIGPIEIGTYSNKGLAWLSLTGRQAVYKKKFTLLMNVKLPGHTETKFVTLRPIGGPPD